MEKPTLNEDELIGFIMRKAFEDEGVSLSYDGVRITIDAHIEYLVGLSAARKADKAEG